MTSEVSSKKRRIMIITADESIIEQLQNNGNTSLFKSIILDSNGENVELKQSQTEQQPTNHTTPTKKVKNDTLTCVVCGSPAHGYNFDAISCESCKAFFRRNALKDPATLECRRSSDCDITIDSRRRCSACRLTKCLSSGMKRDRLLTAEEKANKRQKIEENRNLTRQTSEDVSKSTEQTDSSVLPIKATNLLLLSDYKDLLPQNSRTLLSSDELKRVETVQISFEQRIQLAARDGLPWNPSWYADTLLQQLNARSVTALRLLSFFKQIPEFNELNAEDKLTLVKYNLMPLVILNCSLAYDPEKDRIIEDKSDAPIDYSILIKKHNEDLFNRIKKIFDSFVRIAQHDQRTIQLALVILILTKGSSTNGHLKEPILNDTMAVYRAQNYYTELLWKYLETIHSYDKAIQIFNELVAHFISWQSLQICLQKFCDVLTPSEMNELLPIMKSLLHIS